MTQDNTQKLLDCLTSLGKSKIEIANALRKKGIKGYQDKECSCPIARFLQKEGFGDGTSVSVDSICSAMTSATTPKVIASFIMAFDRGEFPFLIEELLPLEEPWIWTY